MAIIKTIKNLLGEVIYPVTKAKAVYMENNTTVEDAINNIDVGDLPELDDVAYFNNDTGDTYEQVNLVNADLLEGHSASYFATAEEVVAVETEISNLDNTITTLNSAVNTINSNITSITGDINTIEGNITTIEGNINTINSDITSIENELNETFGDSGILPISKGGTGATTADNARANLDAYQRKMVYIYGTTAETYDIDNAIFDGILISMDSTSVAATNLSSIISGNSVYIHQFFYNTVSLSYNRFQVAHGYSSNDMATRYYHNGTWSDWIEVTTEKNLSEMLANTKTISNPNLLINGDFQVWQRGTSFTAAGYAADRWYLSGGSATSAEKLAPKGIHVASTSTAGAWWLRYYFESEYLEHLRGNTVTFSVKIKKSRNFSCYLRSYIYQNQAQVITLGPVTTEWQTLSGTITIDEESELNEAPYFGFVTDGGLNGSDYLDIEYVKLEVGSIATPLSPRPYAEELSMCQRYFYRISTANAGIGSNQYLNIGYGYFAAASRAYIFVSKPQMRIRPTLTCNVPSSSSYLYYTSRHHIISSIGLDTVGVNNFTLGVNTSENMEIGTPVIFNTTSDEFYIDLDSEIYP